MINIFNNDLLKKCNIESLKIDNNIIIDTNFSYNEKLNVKIKT